MKKKPKHRIVISNNKMYRFFLTIKIIDNFIIFWKDDDYDYDDEPNKFAIFLKLKFILEKKFRNHKGYVCFEIVMTTIKIQWYF